TEPVVVVGAGLAGLAAAAFAARAGHPTVVLEKAGAPGGRAVTQRRDGFALNLRPHALYRAGAGMAALPALGVEPRGGVPRVAGPRVDAGRLHALPAGVASLVKTRFFGLGAKLEVARLLATLGRLEAAAADRTSVADWLATTARHESVR